MCETETNETSTVDPSVLELIRDLAQALRAHHLGHTTTEPFARTYYRDHKLINQAEDFLTAAIPEILSKCEFCNAAPDTHEVEVEGKPGITARVCIRCLQELQLGHVLDDIYGWSWTLFEGKFIADYVEPELEPEEVADVPF